MTIIQNYQNITNQSQNKDDQKKTTKKLKTKNTKSNKMRSNRIRTNSKHYSIQCNSLTTKAERKMARDLKNTIIRNIFESQSYPQVML